MLSDDKNGDMPAVKYEWAPHRLPLYLSHREWIKILGWFLRASKVAKLLVMKWALTA